MMWVISVGIYFSGNKQHILVWVHNRITVRIIRYIMNNENTAAIFCFIIDSREIIACSQARITVQPMGKFEIIWLFVVVVVVVVVVVDS